VTRTATILCVLGAACTASEQPLPHGSAASDCASCHADHYAEWHRSPHAQSNQSEVFRAMLPRVEEAWGAAARQGCIDCHAPQHSPDEGITCVSCHAAVGNRGEHSGRLVVDLETPLSGPLDDPLPTDAHGSRPGAFLASPSLCGTCHEVRGPGLFVEPTLTEYRESGLEEIGTGCIDCHMPRLEDAPLVEGGPVRPRRSHRFVAFEAPQLDEALALWVRGGPMGPEVVLENAGAGHHVPTGISFLRDIWVDVRVTDATGATVDRPRVIELGARSMRGDDAVVLPTDADRIEHRSLALGDHVAAPLDLPPDLVPPLELELSLRARRVRREILEALGIAHPVDDAIEVERLSHTVE